MEEVRLELKKEFALGQTTPGTRSYHFFKPVSSNVVIYKCTADYDAFAASFNIRFAREPDFGMMTTESVGLDDYVACRYDEKWWIGVVKEVGRMGQA